MPRRVLARSAVAGPTYVPQLKLPMRAPAFPPDGVAHAVFRAWPNPTIKDDLSGITVLLTIAGFADNGIVDPSIRELSARIPSLRDKQIVDAIDRLELEGWLQVRRGEQPHHQRNEYVVLLQKNSAQPQKEVLNGKH